jgi:ABC-2 type transport system permease protein
MVPFFSPILMTVRMAMHTPPIWQIALSVGILLATMYLILAISSRIYRIGILMYGKRPTLPEIVKWVKYA